MELTAVCSVPNLCCASTLLKMWGHAVAQLVEALQLLARHKSEGRGFDSRWCHWNFSLIHNPSGHTMALGLAQPLTNTNTRNISWGIKAARAWGWQAYYLHVPIVLKSGSLNLLELSGSVQACNGIGLPLPLSSENVSDAFDFTE